MLERIAKVALHETGHLFNLFHCSDEKCLMHFSGNVEELDMSPLYFCRYCSLRFKNILHQD
jgi:archaemetzincin